MKIMLTILPARITVSIPLWRTIKMTQELQDLIDARKILAVAFSDTVGIFPSHEKVWHAIELLNKRINAIVELLLKETVA